MKEAVEKLRDQIRLEAQELQETLHRSDLHVAVGGTIRENFVHYLVTVVSARLKELAGEDPVVTKALSDHSSWVLNETGKFFDDLVRGLERDAVAAHVRTKALAELEHKLSTLLDSEDAPE